MARKDNITIHSSAAEYLTFISAIGDDKSSFEIRYKEVSKRMLNGSKI